MSKYSEEEMDDMEMIITPAEGEEDGVELQVYTDIDHEADYQGDLIEFNPREIKEEPEKCVHCLPPCEEVPHRDVITDLVDAGENLIGGRPFLASKNGMHFGLAGMMLIAGAEAKHKGLTLQCADITLSYKDDKGNNYKASKFFIPEE